MLANPPGPQRTLFPIRSGEVERGRGQLWERAHVNGKIWGNKTVLWSLASGLLLLVWGTIVLLFLREEAAFATPIFTTLGCRGCRQFLLLLHILAHALWVRFTQKDVESHLSVPSQQGCVVQQRSCECLKRREKKKGGKKMNAREEERLKVGKK